MDRSPPLPARRWALVALRVLVVGSWRVLNLLARLPWGPDCYRGYAARVLEQDRRERERVFGQLAACLFRRGMLEADIEAMEARLIEIDDERDRLRAEARDRARRN